MNELIIKIRTDLDMKLVKQWDDRGEWLDFIKGLDNHIISVKFIPCIETKIVFEKEEHLTWFLIKWS